MQIPSVSTFYIFGTFGGTLITREFIASTARQPLALFRANLWFDASLRKRQTSGGLESERVKSLSPCLHAWNRHFL